MEELEFYTAGEIEIDTPTLKYNLASSIKTDHICYIVGLSNPLLRIYPRGMHLKFATRHVKECIYNGIPWNNDGNRWLIDKISDAGKDWGQKGKRALEDEMVGQHHRCNEHELGQTPGDVRDREAWRAADHGVSKSQTSMCDWTETLYRLHF